MRRPRDTFLHYLGLHRVQLSIGVAAATIGSIVAVITPRIVGQIFDELGGNAPFETIVRLGLLMIGVSAVEHTLKTIGRYNVLNAGRSIEYTMRRDLFSRLQRMEIAYFHRNRIGDLMARLTNDLTAVRMMNSQGVQMTSTTSMTFIFTVAAMLAVNVRLALIAVALMPLVSIAFAFIGRRVQRIFQTVQEQFGELAAKALENFSGIRVIKAFSQEDAEVRSFSRETEEYARRAVHLERFQGLMWPTMQFINGFAVLVIMYVGGGDAIRGELTIGQLVQFVAYLQLLSMPMTMIGEVMNTFQQGWASLRRLQQIFNEVPAVDDPATPAETPIRGEVEFRDVTFAYGPAAVLQGVSFKVPAGGSLAIVGATGAGKSSLVNLIPRLFDVTSGQVLLDGVDVRRYALRTLRRAVGYVPQETFLFSVPLRENVQFGLDRDLTEEQLEWAGDISQLNKDVSDFSAKYDTMIGERGVTLSGGQKQRAAIARAVAKDPRILILDDSLSAVDTYTESEILHRLRGVMRERTSIIVAHRISTVKDADEILVLAEGRIAERGTHRELLELQGQYAQMYRRQLLEEELEVDEEQEEHERRVRAETVEEPLSIRTGLDGGPDLSGGIA